MQQLGSALSTHVLVVDDEDLVRDMVARVIVAMPGAFEVDQAGTRKEAYERLAAATPDLAILDLTLEAARDGLRLCRELRAGEDTAEMGIIVFTGDEAELTEVELFDAGADDYVRKCNFCVETFTSRIRAVLRRRGPRPGPLAHGALRVDPGRRELIVEGRPVELTPKEFDIVLCLARNAHRAVDRKELGAGAPSCIRAVDVHVFSIRKKLGVHHGLIETVPRVGYRLGTATSVSDAA